MKIVGIVQVFNEVRNGNLRRCLDNLSRYCDEIAVYDDGSDDDSVSVARTYTPHVIEGGVNDLTMETEHRQRLLDLALTLAPDYLCWLDADEVFDRGATEGGIRQLCETGRSWEFHEITLWRSQTWRRVDIWQGEKHPRLWKASPDMRIPQARGIHCPIVPAGLDVALCPDYRVIHYGFATQAAIERRWRARTALGVPVDVRRRTLDEREMQLERVPADTFPPGIEYVENEPQPTPIRYSEDIMREVGL